MNIMLQKSWHVFAIAFLLIACDKKEITPEGGISLPSLPKQATVSPGYNRAKISFAKGDDRIKAYELFWNDRAKSLKIDPTKQPGETIEVEIEDLEEGLYSFEIVTYDSDGKSAGLVVKTKVYGDSYLKLLKNRTVKELGFIEGGEPYIDWIVAHKDEAVIKLSYIGNDDKTHTVKVINGAMKTALPAYKKDTNIEYITAYVPESGALDTIFMEKVTIPAPVYYSNAVAGIIYRSGLVSKVLSHSYKKLYDGVEYSTIRFENRDKSPLSVYVIKADLNQPQVTLSTLMPNNKTVLNLQEVKAMTEARDNSGEAVLAATNADFFNWTPIYGEPWGPAFVNGTIVKKTAKDNATSYFTIRKDGKPQIGTFSEVAVTAFDDFRDLVGGGVRLIVNDNVRVYNDTEKHPRTMVGYTKDNIVYLVLVDGRQPAHSVGMTYDELSAIMSSLEVREAINLDGGGSSTMVIKNAANKFDIVNKYSDASPRAVANGLGVVLKN